jgi:hypothetical protein
MSTPHDHGLLVEGSFIAPLRDIIASTVIEPLLYQMAAIAGNRSANAGLLRSREEVSHEVRKLQRVRRYAREDAVGWCWGIGRSS